MDRVSREVRSRNMSRVRGKDTSPELKVRRLAHRLGYRFRLHRSDLPGSPDLVFPRLRKAVFVHGCFWHRHHCCRRASRPKTRVEFWAKKFEANIQRDEMALKKLRELGWDVLIVWECETKNSASLEKMIVAFLRPPQSQFRPVD